MANYTYTIDSDNAVSIFNTNNPNEGGAPGVFQPWHPLKPHEPWTREEATAWAEEVIAGYDMEPILLEESPIKKQQRLTEEAAQAAD